MVETFGNELALSNVVTPFLMSLFPCTQHSSLPGWDFEAVGLARVPLRQVLDDVSSGSASGSSSISSQLVDILGADGSQIGTVR